MAAQKDDSARSPEVTTANETPAAAWVKSIQKEKTDYMNFAAYSKVQLEHALRASDHLGVPNGLRTAICFELLENVSTHFERYKDLLRAILRECKQSVYVDPGAVQVKIDAGGSVTVADFFELQPYFIELQDKRIEQAQVNADISILDRKHGFMMDQLATKESVLDRVSERWARTILLQAFHNWHKVVADKRKVRSSMQKAMGRWKKRHLTLIVRMWRQVIVSEKQMEARRRLSTLTESAGDCKDLQFKLELAIRTVRDEIQGLKQSIQKHTLTQTELQATFSSLMERVLSSHERQLQELSNEWGRLCLGLVDAQLLHLTNMLGAVPYETFADPTLLLRPRDDRVDLLKVPEDTIVLKWTSRLVHEQIQFLAKAPPSTNAKSAAEIEIELSRVQNFTTDMKGLQVLHTVLKVLRRKVPETSEPCSDSVVDHLCAWRCPDYLVEHIEHASEGTLASPVCPWQEASASLDEATAAWDVVRSGWRELQKPFDTSMLVGFTPDTTNVAAIVAANNALQNAVQMVQYACSARAANHQLYTALSKRIHTKAIDVLLVRVHGDAPFVMANRREARERATYTTIKKETLNAILQSDVTTEVPKIEAVLGEHYEDLQRIFEYYAASDVGDAGSMSLDEFYGFLKDCKLISKSLTLAYVKKIFHDINEGDVDTELDPFNPDMEFNASEFIHALVCVAERRLGSKSTPLSQRVKRCLSDFVLANACRASMDGFRNEMNASACKAVFQLHQTLLERLYKQFASTSATLSAADFVVFLEECQLLPHVLSIGDVQNILSKIQQEDDVLDGGEAPSHNSALELTFTEFTEAIGAVALYYDPNVFTPIATRLDAFIVLLGTSTTAAAAT
ncbi:hypothetical protein SPRG_16600 [Saprolegnia parasitica CBS 223.65]|uniref:EF-hand domain-containing protein n=1 Tax=Saprolegnia parasitica (strain CBS 223.65) TaxID=695850 RepID=A0A067BUQ4_SAPPC|nr:hypothetical protein SPRG_16600 [Saprolegnia parasitica CBS 223.65]KDO18021.1 hypothetical protein SPRG_16600 [Saprolegnia parasitica CBS 223.65]|eukprot:XP_012211273.1 hypothetical protein SPRG_16600 [Saprolegnia parasitica CBS 223.65]